MYNNTLFIAGSNAQSVMPVGYPAPSKEVEVELALRRKPLAAGTASLNELFDQLPQQRRYYTHDELIAATGGYPEDLGAIEDFFQPFGIQVKERNLLLATVTLVGKAVDFEQAFRTRVAAFQGLNQGRYLATTTPYYLPESLMGIVQADQPLQQPIRKESRLPVEPPPPAPNARPTANTATGGQQKMAQATVEAPAAGYSIRELAQAYQFPANLTGEGQVIGIVELGGQLNYKDLEQFFAQIEQPQPQIVEVGIPPNTDEVNNVEVSMDVQIVGALAPKATLVIYYGVTLQQALQAAVSDEVNKPTVLSVSWAGPERNYSAAEVAQLNLLFYQASLLGITIVAASADYGAYNGSSLPNVSLPASSPLVLGCGGTIATVTDGMLSNEIVWNEQVGNTHCASGGGYSAYYALPYYQAQAVALYPYYRGSTRGVPDVAADASFTNGYQMVLNGQTIVGRGTSAATPFVATLLALLNQKLGYRLGFINAILYGFAGSEAFRPITQGNNDVYVAAPYWNPCTGLGSIMGDKLLRLLQPLEPAGDAPHPTDDAPLDQAGDPQPEDDIPAPKLPTPKPRTPPRNKPAADSK